MVGFEVILHAQGQGDIHSCKWCFNTTYKGQGYVTIPYSLHDLKI